MKFVSHRAM